MEQEDMGRKIEVALFDPRPQTATPDASFFPGRAPKKERVPTGTRSCPTLTHPPSRRRAGSEKWQRLSRASARIERRAR